MFISALTIIKVAAVADATPAAPGAQNISIAREYPHFVNNVA